MMHDDQEGLPEPPPDDGPGLFGGAPVLAVPAPAATPYRVLARAYRPTTFDDLIGQDAMVRILRRAFQLGRVAHAFMLTGVRGVGKTTTARIIARALNCVGPDGTGGPTADPCGVCPNCTAILADRHPDVLEMDAASRTGIDDVREIIEATRFRPMQARMKVFIIDEVHMLSKPAFNAILKTLEEPPAQVSFIFATTELRKVPVTVLSRCQRFDLRRVSIAELSGHFGRIAAKEAAAITDDALTLISRAADGSVRDGLSLLDQAIAQGAESEGGAIGAPMVADMLGLADRGLVFDLLDALMAGQTAAALGITDQAHARGADLGQMLIDLLELVHTVSRLKAIPALRDSNELPEAERVRGAALADALSVPVLGRTWQMLLKGVAEVESAPDRRDAAEMVLIRLCHLADLPTPGELVRQIQTNGPSAPIPASAHVLAQASSQASSQALAQPVPGASGPPLRGLSGGGALRAPGPEPEPETEPEPVAGPVTDLEAQVVATPVAATAATLPGPPSLRSWLEVVGFVKTRREAKLHAQLMHCVHLVRFRAPVIELALEPDAARDLTQRLAAILLEATGTRWTIAVSREAGEPTLAQQAEQVGIDHSRDAASHPLVLAILAAFPGATLGPVNDSALDEYYGLPQEAEPDSPLLGEDAPPDMEFAPLDSEPVGLDDLSDPYQTETTR